MKQFGMFLFAGATGFFIDAASFTLFVMFVNVHIARVSSFFLAVIVTYIINKQLAFKGSLGNLPLYVFGQSGGFLINLSLFEFILLIAGHNPLVIAFAFLFGSCAALAFNFYFAKRFAFGKRD